MREWIAENLWWTLPMLGCAFWISWRWPVWMLESQVRSLMLGSEQWEKENARELRTILALDGHRMPKKLREAVVVWLSEREEP